jgi:myosin-crossreactive antigen
MSKAPLTKSDSGGWALWEKLAKFDPEFGNPAAFNSSIPGTCAIELLGRPSTRDCRTCRSWRERAASFC